MGNSYNKQLEYIIKTNIDPLISRKFIQLNMSNNYKILVMDYNILANKFAFKIPFN